MKRSVVQKRSAIVMAVSQSIGCPFGKSQIYSNGLYLLRGTAQNQRAFVLLAIGIHTGYEVTLNWPIPHCRVSSLLN